MKKSKKGFTLIELIVGLLILGIAVVSGTQLFTAAATGHSRATRLSNATETMASMFDTGTIAADTPSTITRTTPTVNVTIKLNGVSYTESQTLVHFLYDDSYVRAQFFGLKGSYGSGS